MGPVQEGGVRNARWACHTKLGKGAVSIDHKGLPSLLVLTERIVEAFPADDQPRIVQLPLVESGKMLSMPSREVNKRLRDLKYSPFLRQSGPQAAQDEA